MNVVVDLDMQSNGRSYFSFHHTAEQVSRCFEILTTLSDEQIRVGRPERESVDAPIFILGEERYILDDDTETAVEASSDIGELVEHKKIRPEYFVQSIRYQEKRKS